MSVYFWPTIWATFWTTIKSAVTCYTATMPTRGAKKTPPSPEAHELIEVFKEALCSEDFLEKLTSTVCGQLQKEVGELRSLLLRKEEQVTSLKTEVEALRCKTDELEQYSRRNSLRIDGLPDSTTEDPYQEVLKVANTHMKLKPPLSMEDIDRTHRVGPSQESRPRPLLVKFATYRARNRVMKARSSLRHLSPSAPRIFLNEDLTKGRAKLLWEARQKKKEGGINDCWSADGRILIKNYANKIVPISNSTDLLKACKSA